MSDDIFEFKTKQKKFFFTRYNREARLKNAPKKVVQLHNPNFIQRRGLIKSLTANKGLRAVFFVIIILVVLNFILFSLFRDKTNGKVYGIKTELQTFVYNGIPLANIKLHNNLNWKNTDIDLKNGEVVKVQFIFFDKNENKISSLMKVGIYTGAELKFSADDKTKTAKKINVNILVKEKLLQLSKKINE